jgi:hypothetical protein
MECALAAAVILLVCFELPKFIRAFMKHPRDLRAALRHWCEGETGVSDAKTYCSFCKRWHRKSGC